MSVLGEDGRIHFESWSDSGHISAAQSILYSAVNALHLAGPAALSLAEGKKQGGRSIY